MKRASLFLTTVGGTAFCCGAAGLDGPTPVGCTIVALAGALVFLTGVILREMHKQDLEEQAKAYSNYLKRKAEEKDRQEKRKATFFEVWKCCKVERRA